MGRKKSISKNLEKGLEMPELYHRIPGEEFDANKSEVYEWIRKQPELLSYLWSHMTNNHLVQYDSKRGTWKGVEYHG